MLQLEHGSQSNKCSLVSFRAPAVRIKQQCERPKQAPQRTASFANRLAKVPQNTRQVNEGEQQHAVPRIYVHGIFFSLVVRTDLRSRLPCGKRVR